MNIDIIIKVTIPILGAIVTYMIVPFIKQKTTESQRKTVVSLVKIAVSAAEQMQEAGLLNIPKKEYVVNFINSKGFKITEEELNIIIEACVKELNLEQNKVLS